MQSRVVVQLSACGKENVTKIENIHISRFLSLFHYKGWWEEKTWLRVTLFPSGLNETTFADMGTSGIDKKAAELIVILKNNLRLIKSHAYGTFFPEVQRKFLLEIVDAENSPGRKTKERLFCFLSLMNNYICTMSSTCLDVWNVSAILSVLGW